MLPAHCHPFITKQSFVLYHWARIGKADQLLKGVRDGFFIPHDPLGEEPFTKVYNGVFTSRHILRKMKQFLKNHAALNDAE